MSAVDRIAAEAEAIADWKAGDILAGNRLLAMHEGLIRVTVRRYVTARCEIDDLMQVGRIALLRSASGHDATKGRLSTYAVRKIRGNAYRHMRKDRFVVNVPEADQRDGSANVCNLSLDAPAGAGVGTLMDFIAAPEQAEPFGVDISSLLDVLTSRERDVIGRLYGTPPQTLEQAGADLGVTKQAIGATKDRALARMRLAAGAPQDADVGAARNIRQNAVNAMGRAARGAKALRCGVCGGDRHNRRTCPQRPAA